MPIKPYDTIARKNLKLIRFNPLWLNQFSISLLFEPLPLTIFLFYRHVSVFRSYSYFESNTVLNWLNSGVETVFGFRSFFVRIVTKPPVINWFQLDSHFYYIQLFFGHKKSKGSKNCNEPDKEISWYRLFCNRHQTLAKKTNNNASNETKMVRLKLKPFVYALAMFISRSSAHLNWCKVPEGFS